MLLSNCYSKFYEWRLKGNVNSACSESQESDTRRTLSSQMFLVVKQMSILIAILFIPQIGISDTFGFFVCNYELCYRVMSITVIFSLIWIQHGLTLGPENLNVQVFLKVTWQLLDTIQHGFWRETAARYLQISWDPRIPFQENKMRKTEKKLYWFSWTFSELRDSSAGFVWILESTAPSRKTELSQNWGTTLHEKHGSRNLLQPPRKTELSQNWETALLGQHGSWNPQHPRGRLNFFRTERRLCWVCMDPGIHCTLEEDWTFSELRDSSVGSAWIPETTATPRKTELSQNWETALLGQHGSRNLLQSRGRLNFLRTERQLYWVSLDPGNHCNTEEDWTFSELRKLCWVIMDGSRNLRNFLWTEHQPFFSRRNSIRRKCYIKLSYTSY